MRILTFLKGTISDKKGEYNQKNYLQQLVLNFLPIHRLNCPTYPVLQRHWYPPFVLRHICVVLSQTGGSFKHSFVSMKKWFKKIKVPLLNWVSPCYCTNYTYNV